MALALGFLLLSSLPLKWPRIALPLGCFLAWTLLSLAFSPDPAAGLPQVRKMMVYLMMLIVFSAVRTTLEAKWLALLWVSIGTVTAGRGLVQFVGKVAGAKEAGVDFYHFYIADRIRGFMSHWMTFSGQELFILLLLIAFILFSTDVKRRQWLWLPCLGVVGIALVLSDTRSIWIASVVAGGYLVACWNWKASLLIPVFLALGVALGPASVQERVRSIVQPKKQTDSNEHRIVCWRTGWEMIKAHPLLGVGPEEIKNEKVFYSYVPKDISRPLPEGWYGHLHNVYIHYAAERGIPATLFILWALLGSLVDFRKALNKLPGKRSTEHFLLQGATACIIGTMVSGIFEHNLGDTEVLTLFLAIMCLGYTAVKQVNATT